MDSLCNTEMLYFKEYGSCGWKCPNCGNGIVTSYADELFDDTTSYTINLEPLNDSNSDVIKMISKVSGKNLLSARELLIKGGVLQQGSAKYTKEIAIKLKDYGIKYSISPNFPYGI